MKLDIRRDEAELLTDLLLESDHHLARDLAEHIRQTFGMCSEEQERAMKKEAGK